MTLPEHVNVAESKEGQKSHNVSPLHLPPTQPGSEYNKKSKSKHNRVLFYVSSDVLLFSLSKGVLFYLMEKGSLP